MITEIFIWVGFDLTLEDDETEWFAQQDPKDTFLKV
jgi:hypothetical protein